AAAQEPPVFPTRRSSDLAAASCALLAAGSGARGGSWLEQATEKATAPRATTMTDWFMFFEFLRRNQLLLSGARRPGGGEGTLGGRTVDEPNLVAGAAWPPRRLRRLLQEHGQFGIRRSQA